MPNYTNRDSVINFIGSVVTRSFELDDDLSNINTREVEDTDFLFLFDNVTIDDDYNGEDVVTIEFDTITTYKIYRSRKDKYTNLYTGAGSIATPLTLSGFIGIPAGTFGGVINIGDKLTFTVRRLMSLTQLDLLIDDAETEVDSFAKSKNQIIFADDTIPLFPVIPDTPADIELAARFWTVGLLIEKKLINISFDSLESEKSEVSRFKNSARKKIQQYLDKDPSAPSIVKKYDETVDGERRRTLNEIAANHQGFDNRNKDFTMEGTIPID